MSEDGEDRGDELQRMASRLEWIEETVAGLVRRVFSLEQSLRPPATEQPPPEAAVAEPPPVSAVPPVEECPASVRDETEQPPEQAAPATPQPSVAPSTAAPPTPPVPARARGFRAQDFEAEIALKWLARVGVVALTIGAAFFLQHAFASNWIGPVGQVSLGIIVGLVLLAIGEQQRQLDRDAFGQALVGGGIAILFASIYAAYAAFSPRLLAQPLAFALMALVTALAVTLGVRANALSTVILATVGAFLTPVLIRQSGTGAGISGMVMLFGYIAVLDLGLLALSFFKQWRVLQFLSFVGTWAMMWGWLGSKYDTHLAWPAYITMGLFFLIFAFVPVVRNLWQRSRTRQDDLWLILLNAAFFFPTVALLPTATDLNEYLGFYAVVMSVFYLGLGGLARERSPDDKLLILSWLGLGLTFIILAVPLQLRGHWIMVGWAIEGGVIVWMGHRLRHVALRVVGLILQTVAATVMLLGYLPVLAYRGPDTLVFLNATFLSFAICVLALAASLYIYRGSAQLERETEGAGTFLEVAIAVLTLWGVTVEMLRDGVGGPIVMLTWAAAGVFLVWLGIRWERPIFRTGGLLVQAVVVAWLLLIYDIAQPHRAGWYIPIFNQVFVCFFGSLAAFAMTLSLYAKSGDRFGEAQAVRSPVPAILIGVIVLWGLTKELGGALTWASVPHDSRGFAISALWCIYAAAMVGIGMSRRSRPVRLFGLAVFGAAIIKVFVFDLAGLQTIWRILSFVCLGLILIGAGYLYNRYGDLLLGGEREDDSA